MTLTSSVCNYFVRVTLQIITSGAQRVFIEQWPTHSAQGLQVGGTPPLHLPGVVVVADFVPPVADHVSCDPRYESEGKLV